ncbi:MULTISPECIES: hypothetical protein [Sorangium]|uniref:Uncharacterized protein n=1 Tax=Sorangium cellulosum TaxID=56 RepID=A0A150QZN2_SORCE|nr:hypothetical protein [Sorangium cellulosum]KYF73423.1 hypothetical protein BE15_40655 [Sorangium cellulosum]
MVCKLRSRPAVHRRARRAAVLVLALVAGGCVSRVAPEPGLTGPRRAPAVARAAGEQVGLNFWVPDGPAARVLSLQVPESDEGEPAEDAPPATAASRRATSADPDEERRYVLLPGVALAPVVEEKVAEIADAYFRRTGKELVVTSGTRDPERQAEAMHELFRHGADVLGLYKDKAAAREIKSAYEEGLSADQPPEALIEALEHVIRAQIDRGVFISAHLREGAVDVRNRDMTPAEKRAFLDGVEEVGGVLALEESRPPHYHLQID